MIINNRTPEYKIVPDKKGNLKIHIHCNGYKLKDIRKARIVLSDPSVSLDKTVISDVFSNCNESEIKITFAKLLWNCGSPNWFELHLMNSEFPIRTYNINSTSKSFINSFEEIIPALSKDILFYFDDFGKGVNFMYDEESDYFHKNIKKFISETFAVQALLYEPA